MKDALTSYFKRVLPPETVDINDIPAGYLHALEKLAEPVEISLDSELITVSPSRLAISKNQRQMQNLYGHSSRSER